MKKLKELLKKEFKKKFKKEIKSQEILLIFFIVGFLFFSIFGGPIMILLNLILNIFNHGGTMNIITNIYALISIFSLFIIIAGMDKKNKK